MKFSSFYITFSILLLNVNCDCVDDDNGDEEKLIFAQIVSEHFR